MKYQKIQHQDHVFQKPLIATTDKYFKEGIVLMETKPNVEEEAITHTIAKNCIDAINDTIKPQAYQSKKR